MPSLGGAVVPIRQGNCPVGVTHMVFLLVFENHVFE